MNLYLFNDNDSAAIYGIGAYLKELMNVLDNTDIHVHIVHLHSDRPEFEIVNTDKIEHWYIPEVKNNNTFSGPVLKVEGYLRNVTYLLRLHINDTNDLVFHFNFNLCLLIAKELKESFNCKTVATVHFMKWALELHGNLARLQTIKTKPKSQRSSFEQLLYKTDDYEGLFYKQVDRLIALSKYTQAIICNEYQLNPDKVCVIPNGLADISCLSVDERFALRRKWGYTENELLILFAGRLQAVKGLTFLIRAFRKVLAILPNCRLIVAGNGDFSMHLNECEDIWTNVTWTGLIGKDKLYELYSIADIGVMPSFHEQCSYVAIEMMMHGLPIIGSTSTGLKEMISDGETGWHIPVVEYDDSVEIDTSLLAEKMMCLLQNPAERKRMGTNARKRYECFYSAAIFRKNMLEFYESL